MAFTLAEVLITLGIVGIVAALTIPTLVNNYQKRSYYVQFMKARSVIENALKLYANDHGCSDLEPLCNPENDAVEEFSKYFKGATLITNSNAADICKGYDKLPIAWKYYDKTRDGFSDNCEIGEELFSSTYSGFTSMGGLLVVINTDLGYGFCSLVDVNGPDAGPNIAGRDIFSICLYQPEQYCGNLWGFTKECMEKNGDTSLFNCFGIGANGMMSDTCGARLIREGKMTY